MTQPGPQFEALLIYLKESRGFDFTGYKRSSLMRRVNRRMGQAGFETYSEYLDHLQVHPDEFTALFNTILINVTGFFRDREAWDHLRKEILPTLVRGDGPIRVWSAGCAGGQEAYSLAIAFAEELGADALRQRVKIFATDVDEDGLAQSRLASYTERDINGMSPEIIERYFETDGTRYVFRNDLRRSVIFGRNDLIQDAPISRIDLLVCRNVLMYFNAEAQARVLSRFHFALADCGVLFLGKAEMLLSHGDLFAPADLNRRIFRKVSRHLPMDGSYELQPVPGRWAGELVGLDRVRSEAFFASPVAQVVVTGDGFVALVNRQAEMMFGVSARHVGRPFRDLELSYRPLELRGYIEQAQMERRPRRITDIEHRRGPGDVLHLEVQVNPLVGSGSRLLGVVLVFLDITAGRRLQDELEHANRQLETAYEELHATNEELETTNEELQSTVEELETTNEELQSANEELQTINDELRDRTAELDSANAFLETVFVSLKAGVVAINQDLQVRVWNRRCEDLWGLSSAEAVGQHFLKLDVGLPTGQLGPMIRKLLTASDGSQEISVPSVDRRGRQIEVRVTGTPLRRDGDGTTGVVLIMELEKPVV